MPLAAYAEGRSQVFSNHNFCLSPPNIYTTLMGSPNVSINGVKALRVTDIPATHPSAGCFPEAAPLAVGSPTVFVNGLAMGRVGDTHGCGGIITTGSPNVNVN